MASPSPKRGCPPLPLKLNMTPWKLFDASPHIFIFRIFLARVDHNNSMDLQNVPPPILRYLLGADRIGIAAGSYMDHNSRHSLQQLQKKVNTIKEIHTVTMDFSIKLSQCADK